MIGAVAVDFGASSGRYAAGWLEDGQIRFEIVDQVPHGPEERNGRLEWDIDRLVGLCRAAAAHAESRFESSTLGIDTWGVDHGFVGHDGKPLGAPVCYRETSHLKAFEMLAPHRARLYALTGIQHQPFNTICQLLARRLNDPDLPKKAANWYILPDYLGYVLTGEKNMELTQASTTQLLGLDDKWSPEAFEMIGWPTPEIEPTLPGGLGPRLGEGNVRIAHVGSHDTASAVCGFGQLADDQVFLNVGTWSLVGCVIDRPLASPEAEAAMFTNERTIDGRVRFLKNIPGFYVINRIHEELGLKMPVPQWLADALAVDERIDLLHPDFYNPPSMVEICAELAGRRPTNEAEWAGLALSSLTSTIAKQPAELEKLTGRKFASLRVGGGGSQSHSFCQSLANESGLPVYAGPAEATVLGNLGLQLLASGQIGSMPEMFEIVSKSAHTKVYRPIA
ncbi:MAG: FGGY family carbohydrate kinase [Fimbriimonas sp.]|nr:FGGY family carbohydrate kinase [Fimbriimonas sp.]